MDIPTTLRSASHRLGWALATMALAACSTTPTGPTTYLISSDQELSVQQLARTARILSRYRDLTDAELAQVERRLQRVFEDIGELGVPADGEGGGSKGQGGGPPRRQAHHPGRMPERSCWTDWARTSPCRC